MKTNPNDAAFAPTAREFTHGNAEYGLSKLEYFSIHILTGMIASTPGCVTESCAVFAVKEAKVLIDELNKKDGEIENETNQTSS